MYAGDPILKKQSSATGPDSFKVALRDAMNLMNKGIFS
jgi:hypothetical protein